MARLPVAEDDQRMAALEAGSPPGKTRNKSSVQDENG
jgi:hypothetical protein